MSAAFRVDLSGQSVQFRFQNVSFAGIREIVLADISQDINTRAAKAANLSDLADTTTARLNLGVGQFETMALAEAATVPAAVNSIRLEGRTTGVAGGGEWVRTSLATITAASYPAAAYFRTADRYMPDGSTDATNGGYWLLSGDILNAEALGVGAGGDDATKLEDALTFANGRRLVVNGGTSISLLTDALYTGAAVDIEFKPGSVVTPTSGRLYFQAALSALPALGANIAANDNVITFATAHGLAVGDVFGVHNPTDYSWSLHRPEYQAGAMYKVAAVPSSTTVRIYGTAEYAATSADFNCYKLAGTKCHVRGLKTATSGVNIPLWIDGYENVLIDDFDLPISTAATTNIDIYRCFGVLIGRGKSATDTGDSYPISVANSYNVIAFGLIHLRTPRHTMAIGGRDGDMAVPTTNVQIFGGVLQSDQNLAVGSSDTHGGARRVTFNGATIQYANVGGQDVTYNNCLILGRKSDGTAVFGSEVRGGFFDFNNCRFVCETAGSSFGLFGLSFPGDTLSENVTINLRNPVWEIRANATSARLMWLSFTSGTPPTKTIEMNVYNPKHQCSGAPASIVRLTSTDDLTSLVSVNIYDRIVGTAPTLISEVNNVLNNGCIDVYPQRADGITTQGDANVTLNALSSGRHHLFATTLTANRTVTLPTTASVTPIGTRYVIHRTAGGAFTLTVASVSHVLGQNQWCEVQYDGSAWKVIRSGGAEGYGATADVGDAAKTLTCKITPAVQIWNTPLTADRAVTLSTTNVFAGAVFRIVRTAASTGAFNLNVGTGPLKALAAGAWCEVSYNGSAWVLTAYGTL